MKKALFQRAVCLVLTVATLMTGLGFTVSAGKLKDPEGDKGIYTTLEEMQALVSTSSYADYIDDYAYLMLTQKNLSPIVVDVVGKMQEGGSGIKVSESDKCEGIYGEGTNFGGLDKANSSVYLPAVGATSWEIEIKPEWEGLYYIKFDYYTCQTDESSISSIERALKINGKIPFDQARSLNFSKVWTHWVEGVNKETVTEPYSDLNACFTEVDYEHTKGEGGSYKKIVTTVKDGVKTTTTYTMSQDINGNSMSPEATQNPQWNEYYCQDASGYEQEWFLFYVSEGQYRITLEAEREPMIIGGITLIPYSNTEKEIVKFEDYLAAHPGATAPNGGSIVEIQAEFPDSVSDSSVTPSNDNTSAATYPIASGAQLYNVIGETSYSAVGQWAAYKFTVDKTGLYKFGMRYLQKALEGMFICRSIKISGGEYGAAPVTPYEEAASAKFNYSKDWQSTYVCDDSGEALQFYFEEDVEYTIYLECSLGSLKQYIQRVEATLANLNSCYLRILQLTGPDPDKYRDYKFYQVMPDVLVTLVNEANNLMNIKKELEDFCGTAGSHTATLETVAIILYKMGIDEGEKIAANMASLKTYLGTLGTWINDSKKGAMMVDSISVVPANMGNDGLEKAEAGFFKSLWFELVSFVYSFFTDYNAMGLTKKPTASDSAVDVWFALGRDQSQIWRTMIDAEDGYTNLTGNAANLKLVTAGTLLPSILSGKGPDVYMGLSSGDVINYAIRDAVMGISGNVSTDKDEDADQYNKYFANDYYTYKDADGNYNTVSSLDEVPAGYTYFESKSYEDYVMPYDKGANGVAYEAANFSQAAIDTVTLLDVAYGIPQTMSFAMMFYRMDVFAELGLEVPESWSQLLSTLPVLQTNNMEVGVAYISALDFMIYQMGGSMWKYTDKDLYDSKYAGAKIDLDNPIATEAFEFTCRLYTDYSLPISYDTANRFRTGEMPVVVGDYASIYNTLVVFATEINGLWEFTSLPGSERADGTFNYDSLAGVTATVMLHGCDNVLAAWQFMQWQTGEDAQSKYGNRMVALVGPSAKYESANLKALNNLSWTASEKEAIKDQMMHLSSIVNYPGSYIIARYLKFAFLDAVNDGADPHDSLMNYVDAINSEIERKREEFDLWVPENNEEPPKLDQAQTTD